MTTAQKNILEEQLIHGFNAQQSQAVMAPFHQGVQILAGAGTGKTRVITHRFVRALHESMTLGASAPNNAFTKGSPESSVLAVTFTVKAAEEMKSRIYRLMSDLNLPQPESSLWVHNFHGYGRRLLKSYGWKLGIPESFTVLDSQERLQVLSSVLSDWESGPLADAREALAWAKLPLDPESTFAPPHPLPLDWLQWARAFPEVLNRAKSAGLSPLAFLTVALQQSDGFTTAVVQQPLAPSSGGLFESTEDIALTAWKHWKPWAPSLSTWLGTEEEQSAERDARADKKDPENLEAFYSKKMEWFTKSWLWMENGQPKKPMPRKVRNKVEPAELESLAVLAPVFCEEAQLITLMAGLYAVYQYRLHQQCACDFDDLILKPLELFEAHPDVKEAVQQQFKLVIVDEFQDTNSSQLALIRHTLRPDVTNLTVVGDSKQSIYGFRDAQPDNMHWVFTGRCDVETIHLSNNYRSDEPIVTLANGVADTLQLPDTKALTASRDNTHPTHTIQPVVHVSFDKPDDELDAPKLRVGQVRDEESAWVAEEIKRLHVQEGLPYRDVAILVRDHTKAKHMAAALQQANIPNDRQEAMADWLKSPVIKDVRALIALLARPTDDAAWVRLLQKKLNQHQLRLLATAVHEGQKNAGEASGRRTVFWVDVLCRLGDLTLADGLSIEVREALLDFAQRVLAARQQLNRKTWATLTYQLAWDLGLFSAKDDGSVILPETVMQWLYRLATQPATRSLSLKALCQWIDYQTDTATSEWANADTEPNPDSVRILTMHAAKGLEYKAVFVSATDSFAPKMQAGPVDLEIQYPAFLLGHSPTSLPGFGLYLCNHHRFWSSSGSMKTVKRRLVENLWLKPRAEAEMRRLFYVAITRAQERLYVLRGPKSPDWTDPERLIPAFKHAEQLKTIQVTVGDAPSNEIIVS